MSIYIYAVENKLDNYVGGQWYFVASNELEAFKIINDFQIKFNKDKHQNYIIKFNLKEVYRFEVKKGFISLNRSTTDGDYSIVDLTLSTYIKNEMEKFLCQNGNHVPSESRKYDGSLITSICMYCNKPIIMTVQGNWDESSC